MIFDFYWRTIKRNNGISNIFIQGPIIFKQYIGHIGQVLIQKKNKFAGG